MYRFVFSSRQIETKNGIGMLFKIIIIINVYLKNKKAIRKKYEEIIKIHNMDSVNHNEI